MDQRLVQAAQQGCEVGRSDLYEQLFPEVVRHIAGRGATWQDAEDAAQESLLIVLDRLEHVRAASALPAYAKSIARRVSWQRIDDARRRVDAARTVAEGPAPSAESINDAAEDASRVRMVFEQLSERDRELLHARVVAEHSVDEVAHHFDVTPGSARVLVSRARRSLREAWKAWE